MTHAPPLVRIACALALLIACAGCGDGATQPTPGSHGDSPASPAADRIDIGLVYDAGGRGDKSFNDSAYLGMTRACQEFKLVAKDIEPSPQTSKEAALRRLAQRGTPLILGIGILFSAEITALAEEFPALRFACIDYNPPEAYASGAKPLPPNLLGVRFREQEGAYLIGAIAALVGNAPMIGFVGGMEIPLIKRFEAGYRAGARSVRGDIEVLVDYAGTDASAWKNPTKGKEMALAQYQRGAFVIFHASGSTGLGVFAAAKETGKLAIGVDADQSAEAPEHIVTSQLKRVDEAVYRAIKDHHEGAFKGGVHALGLAEGAIGYVRTEQNARWITPGVAARVDELALKIASGEIAVPDK